MKREPLPPLFQFEADDAFASRFWERVERPSPSACWRWTGASDRHGYGSLRHKGRTRLAHRTAWQITHGAIAAGVFVLHKCDNPRCVNPAHLFLGSQADNVHDMRTKGRGFTPRKLTAEAVTEIRAAVASGTSQRALAARYSVDPSTISHAVRGKSWSSL